MTKNNSSDKTPPRDSTKRLEKPFRVLNRFRKSRSALRESNLYLETILTTARAGMWIWDLKEEWQTTPGLNLLFGRTEDDPPIAFEDFSSLIHSDDLSRVSDAWQRTVQTHDPYEQEYRVIWRDGSVHWVTSRGNILKTSSGVTQFVGISFDITERKRSEEALRESENKFKDLVEKSNAGVYLIQDRIHRYVNAKLAEIHGYDPDEMIDRMGPEHTIHPDEWAASVESMRLRDTGVRSQYRQFRIVRKDGEIRDVEVYGSKTMYRGRPAVIGTMLDITERKRAEKTLQYHSLILRHINDAVVGTDPQFTVTAWNKAAELMYGYTSEEVVGRSFGDIIHPHYIGMTREQVIEQLMKMGSVDVEALNDTKNGRTINVRSHTVTLKDDKGSIIGFVGVNRDITESKRAMERLDIISSVASELLRSKDPQSIVEKLCRRVMEHLDCHVFFNYLIDDSGNRLRLNAYAGIPEETAREILFLDFGVAVCGCAARDATRIVAENIPSTPDVRTELVRSFGVKAYAAHPLFVGSAVIGTLSFGTRSRLTFSEDDLSLMKAVADHVSIAMERARLLRTAEDRAEELEIRVRERTTELSQAYDDLQQEMRRREETEERLRQSHKMEAIGTLAGGIAHDFNNILAGMMGFAEMALEDTENQPHVQKSLTKVLQSAKRAKDLVKQILTFSRKSDYQRAPVSVTPIVKETIKLLRATIPATIHIKFRNTVRSDTVIASPTEIQQILMNLATNGFMAMEEKGGTLEISLSESFHSYNEAFSGDYLQISVKDTGVGMTREVMQKVFDPFFTTREPGKGTGMGLAVVYGIVRNLNGEITVSSEPGHGSTFSVLLPKTQAETGTKQDTSREVRGGKETILYVEDEEMLNEWGKAVLEKFGYTVHAYRDPEEALIAFTGNPSLFDLVITDQAMPNMAGSELVSRIHKLRIDIPVILSTGYQEPVTPEKAKETGINEVLSKPLTKTELAAAVRKTLDHKNVTGEI